MQEVEAYEDIGVVFEGELFVGRHLTVEGTLIGQLLRCQLCVELVIDITNMTPEAQEPFLELRVMRLGEITEEAFDHLLLLGGEIGAVVELMDITDIRQYLICWRHVLIQVVEVGQQQLPPAIEMVEGLVDTRTGREHLMQLTDQQDGVCHLEVGMRAEQVADGDIGRTPDRLACQTGKVLVEEQRCTLVGEHHRHT